MNRLTCKTLCLFACLAAVPMIASAGTGTNCTVTRVVKEFQPISPVNPGGNPVCVTITYLTCYVWDENYPQYETQQTYVVLPRNATHC